MYRLFVLLFLLSASLNAQDTLNQVAVNQDEANKKLSYTNTLSKNKKIDTTHSPLKAALLSIVPGAGQIYNSIAMPIGKKHAYWKVPIIYAGLGVTGYFFLKNNKKQRLLKDEYRYREKYGVPNLSEYAQYDDQGILTQFETARRNRDLMLFAFVAVYGLNILDAYVEAHFIHFDISKDLSLNLRPKMLDLQTIGLGFSLSFH